MTRRKQNEEAKKADLNVEFGKLDMQNTLNKSAEAVQKQQNAAGDVSSLKQQVAAQKTALEQASNDLAELQAKLSSQEAVADADPGAVTEEEKEKMEITNNLSELDQMSAQELVEAAKKGIKADITVAGKTYEGEVTSVSHVATQNEKGASLISADIRIKNPDEDIFLGVDAKVTIQAEEADNVVVLPSEVVNIGKEGSFCYVLENGIITRKDITTGISPTVILAATLFSCAVGVFFGIYPARKAARLSPIEALRRN